MTFDVGLMTADQCKYLYEAERALMLAGVVFDLNMCADQRVWELDWSLTGATILIRDYCCSYNQCQRVLGPICLWAVFEVPSSRKVLYFPYCSPEHQSRGILEERQALGWRILACY